MKFLVLITLYLLSTLVSCSENQEKSHLTTFERHGLKYEVQKDSKSIMDWENQKNNEILAEFKDLKFKFVDLYEHSPTIQKYQEQVEKALKEISENPHYKGKTNLKVYNLQRLIYEEYLRLVSSRLERLILFDEAKRENISIEDYLNKYVFAGSLKLTEEEFDKTLEKKGISPLDITPPLKKKLTSVFLDEKRKALVRQFIEKQLMNAPIKLYFQAPRQELDLNKEWVIIRGEESVPLTIHLFSNFSCEYCKRVSHLLKKQLKKYPQKFNIAYRFFIYSTDRKSQLAIDAALCVNDQGKDLFWQFHDKLIDFEHIPLEEDIRDIAKGLSLDFDKFKKCYLSRRFKEVSDYYLSYADYLGVEAEPTLVIGNEVYQGAVEENLIESGLKKKINSIKGQKNGVLNFIKRLWKYLFS